MKYEVSTGSGSDRVALLSISAVACIATRSLSLPVLTSSRSLLFCRGLSPGRRLKLARVSTLFVRATAGGAFLRGLLQQKRRAALRTLFRDWLVPVNHFALWIFRAAVEGLAAFSFLDQQLPFAARPRTGDSSRLALDVFAFRII